MVSPLIRRCLPAGLAVGLASMASVAGSAEGPEPPRFVRGDVNADYLYNVTDAIHLLEYLFVEGETPPCLSAADAGDDGRVDLGDALTILFYLFLEGDAGFPAPFPSCGFDPTPDALDCASYPACGTPPRKTSAMGLEFIYVEPGSFMMGSPPTERGRWPDEVLHEVTITCGYYLGKYEVTREQYGSVMGSFPLLPPEFEEATGGPDLPNTPVFGVSWNEAMEFCRKLSQLEGLEYRLPTEAEWEYACRAGTQTRFSFGDALECIDESCTSQPPDCKVWDYLWEGCHPLKKPVDGKLPNPWGLYGMHGNLAEWCADWYAPYLNRPATDPKGPRSGTYKVMRGDENHVYALRVARSAARIYNDPPGRGQNVGFRVVQATPCRPRVSP